MSFAPENPLEEALRRAVTDPAARPQFYALLMQSPLYVLGHVKDHTEVDAVLPSLAEHYFELLQITLNGRNYHPVFTAVSRIRALTREAHPYFTVQGRALFEQTRGAAFLINLGSEAGKELLPREIEQLLEVRPRQGMRPEVVIGLPEPYPGKLAGALGILFLNRFQVASAHLVQAKVSSEPLPRYLVGLVAEGDAGRLSAEIGEVAMTLKTRNPIDVMLLNPANPGHELAARLLAVPPFYARPIKPN